MARIEMPSASTASSVIFLPATTPSSPNLEAISIASLQAAWVLNAEPSSSAASSACSS